jgi:hypothetical protein
MLQLTLVIIHTQTNYHTPLQFAFDSMNMIVSATCRFLKIPYTAAASPS